MSAETSEKSVLKIEAGDETEEVLQALLANLDDATLDTIDVERVTARGEGLASEPTTISVILAIGPPLVIALARALDRYLETRRQLTNMALVMTAYGVSDEAGRALAEIAKAHANVAVSLKAPKPGRMDEQA